MNNGKGRFNRKVLAVFAVLLMLASTLPIMVESEESDAATTDWKCTVTINKSTITTKYEKGGAALADTTPVNGISQTVGSWGFDNNGCGPFNSFYAAFNPATGKMVCHLNPNNLKQAVDGTDISGKGYNIMWCLPKIYVSVSGSTLTMSSDSADGTLASAFTVGGTSYNYLAIGVYEATLKGSVLGSESGKSPLKSLSLADYRTGSKNAKVETGVTLLWNYHMYELYRMCSLAVMENFDSQAQVGYGNVSGSSYSQTGQTDGYGPYYGTSSSSSDGAKLFIENAWGSLSEYVDDAWWYGGLYAGQNLNPTSDTSNKTKTTVKSGLNGYGKYPYSTELDSWGLPTSTSSSQSSTAPDFLDSSQSSIALIVGGGYGASAGLSRLDVRDVRGNSNVGSRLAFLFADDSAAPPTESDGSTPTFTYTITPDGNIVGDYTAIAGDAAESGAYTSSNGTNVGSWGFDSKGYGPFNSFYAAFDPTQNNKMICHLDPNDLTRSIDGESISGKSYNIMWCLPTVYWSTDSSGNLILSNDPSKGTAYAHTIDGKVYKYIGIGVYEASTKSISGVGTILTSTSGDIPLVSQTRATFRDYANNQSVNTAGTGNNGYAMVWNFYQWELYKYCALAVMGSWDSQGVAGNGSVYRTSSSDLVYDLPGSLDESGPYAGTKGSVYNSSYNQNPVKVFIENAWGSLYNFVDGVVIMDMSLVVDSKSVPTDATVSGTNVVVYSSILPGSSGYGSTPSTKAGVWGMPTAANGTESSGLYDYIYSITGSNYILTVGGCSATNLSAAPNFGLSCASAYNDRSLNSTSLGGRLAFVFDADLASTPTVTLDHSNLTAEGGDATGLRTSIDITDGATYPDLNTVADNPSIMEGWTHTGWEVGDATYLPGDRIEITESHTAKSLWAAPRNVEFDHSALSDIGGNTDGLPTKAKIDDLTDGYPDLNTYTGNSSIQDGYVHVGWHVDGKFYAIGTPVLHDTTHTAYSAWVVPQILITFMVEGEVHSTLSVPKGSVGVVYTPVMVEGVFEGWYYDPEYTDKYDSSRPLDGPTTLYAKGVPQLVFTSVPTADATIAPVDYKGLFFFDATGSSGRYQVHWDFGDGNTSDEPIAYNTYTEPGRYTVKLTVTNIYGEQAESEYVVDLRDGTAADNMKWFAVGALCVIAAGLVIRRIL